MEPPNITKLGWGQLPTLSVLVIVQATQQIVGYGLMTPGQNLLFTLLSKQERYVSKGFIDTVLFRFSDVVAGQLCSTLTKTGLSLGFSPLLLIPALSIWLGISWTLGRRHDTESKRAE
ncbi:MAG: hypothetical protein ABL921_14035 [Pirellula sp.]